MEGYHAFSKRCVEGMRIGVKVCVRAVSVSASVTGSGAGEDVCAFVCPDTETALHYSLEKLWTVGSRL